MLENKSKITETFENIRKLSFEEKRASAYDESQINQLLDQILDFKKMFSNKTDILNILVEEIEQVTWFNDIDDESLMSINDLIASVRDLHSSLLRQYISLNFISSKGIANEEIINYKAAIDDLNEVAADLESRFFFLPNITDFNETTKQLSLV